MNGTSTLKRRRPHTADDLYSQNSLALSDGLLPYATEDQFVLQPQEDLYCPNPPLYSSYSSYNSYIIGAAADIFQCSPNYLVESTYYDFPQQKRQRITHELDPLSMSQLYSEDISRHGPEKFESSAPSNLCGHVDGHWHGLFPLPLTTSGSFLASTASGVADCLAGLAACQGPVNDDSSPEYEAILAASASAAAVSVSPDSSQYTDSIPHADISNIIQVNEPYSDVYGAPDVENWLSDSSTESARYMQSYPALQPTIAAPTTTTAPGSHLMRIQPSTHMEDMYYPPNGQLLSRTRLKMEDINDARLLAASSAVPPIPALTASLQEAQSLGDSVPPPPPQQQQPVDGVVYAREPQSLSMVSCYRDPVMQPMTASNGGYVSVSADVSSCSTAVVLPSPSTPGTVVGPHYTHMPSVAPIAPIAPVASAAPIAPVVVPQHHHHYVLKQMPFSRYMSETAIGLSERPPQRPPAARRGPFKDQTIRQKTAQTRKDGSCIRCRMQRIRCEAVDGDTKGQCACCMKPLSRTWRLPCMRLKINDVVLAKTTQVKGHEWTLRWKDNTVLDDVGHWASSEVRTLRISEGYTDDYVEFRVRRFIPQYGDSLTRSWVTPDGERRSVQIPPYAIIEPEAIGPQYGDYIKRGLWPCCKNVLAELGDTLIWTAYSKVFALGRKPGQVSDPERDVLMSVIELWMTVRLTTRSFEIVGDETLGMPKDILDETSPSHGKIPIPPVMGAQLDSVLINQIQHNLRKDALKKLGKIISDNRTNTWITIFLAIFVLLHNAALVIKHDASYARKHGIRRRFAREDKVHQYYTGAITLLAYFHYCNKGVFPFTAAAKETEIRNIANLDDDGMQFVRETRKTVIEKRHEWQTLLDTNAYEDDFYFVSQMFEENWQPRPMQI